MITYLIVDNFQIGVYIYIYNVSELCLNVTINIYKLYTIMARIYRLQTLVNGKYTIILPVYSSIKYFLS